MAAVLDIHTLHPAARFALPGPESDKQIRPVSGQHRHIVDPASSTLNDNFEGQMFALQFQQRVTFQLIPFRECREARGTIRHNCFRGRAGEVISGRRSKSNT